MTGDVREGKSQKKTSLTYFMDIISYLCNNMHIISIEEEDNKTSVPGYSNLTGLKFVAVQSDKASKYKSR